jgi:hypothetical protein
MVGLRSLNEDLSLPTPAHEKESEEKKYAITARNTRASQRHADEEHDDNDNEEAFNDEFLVRARKDGVMLLPSYLELSKGTSGGCTRIPCSIITFVLLILFRQTVLCG